MTSEFDAVAGELPIQTVHAYDVAYVDDRGLEGSSCGPDRVDVPDLDAEVASPWQTHVITGLYAPLGYAGGPIERYDVRELQIACGATEPAGVGLRLVYDGECSVWTVAVPWRTPVARWENPPTDMRADRVYVLRHVRGSGDPLWPNGCRVVFELVEIPPADGTPCGATGW